MLILEINTTDSDLLRVSLQDDSDEVACESLPARRRQAEELIPAIERLLDGAGYSLNDLNQILVHNRGESFTALRIGIVTANALSFALGIPVVGTEPNLPGEPDDLVLPKYASDPDIIIKKRVL
ncbi:hypothetical protein HGA64_01775 [Candidatus Falkowbacteria bacterium]|nr:hypothetical protein [Candidatus Falkowbacteria bacterium]